MDNQKNERPGRKRMPSKKKRENLEQQENNGKKKKNKSSSNTNKKDENLISHTCTVCNKTITGRNDTEILENHYELEEYIQCKNRGLFHCTKPCTKYYLRAEQRKKHFVQRKDCRDRHAVFTQAMEIAMSKNFDISHSQSALFAPNNYSFRNYHLATNREKILRTTGVYNLGYNHLPGVENTNSIASREILCLPTEFDSNDNTDGEVIPDRLSPTNNTNLQHNAEDSIFTTDTTSLLQFKKAVSEQSEGTVIPPHVECFIRLEEMLRQINAPSDMYPKIIEWATTYASILSSDRLDKISLDKLYKIMLRNVFCEEMSALVMPKTENVHLPSGQVVNLTSFDVLPSIFELLNHPNHTKYESLIYSEFLDHPKNINRDPFFVALYDAMNANETIGHLVTGKWYKEVFEKVITNKLLELLIPIPIYIDATAITNAGSISMEVICMTLGVFIRKIRDSSTAWKTLGYIPSMLQKILENNNLSPQQKAEDYHFILKIFLKRIRDTVSGKTFEWEFIDHNGKTVKKLLRFEVIFIMGDTKGQDLLCGRYASHSTKGIGRMCTCSTEDSDNPFVDCRYLNKNLMNSKTEEELNNASFRMLTHHAFRHFSFGTDQYDIYTSTPPDTLHCFMLGICDRLYSTFIDNLTDNMYMKLNYNVARIAIYHSRQAELDLYPDIRKFKDGIKLRGIITAKQRLSRVYMIYLVMLTTDFHEVLFNQKGKKPKTRKPKKKKQTNDESSKIINEDEEDTQLYAEDDEEEDDTNWRTDVEGSMDDEEIHTEEQPASEALFFNNEVIRNWILAFEKTILFYAFLTSHEVPIHLLKENRNGTSIATVCSQNFLLHLRRTLNRVEGYGLKLFKFHVHKHWSYFIEQYGAPWNYDTGRNESFHIQQTKALAKRTRRISSTVDQRTCENQFHRHVLQKNLEKINEKDSIRTNKQKKNRLNKYGREFNIMLSYSESNGDYEQYFASWTTTRLKTDRKHITLNEYTVQELMVHLGEYSKDDARVSEITCYAEITINNDEEEDGIRVRAHPYLYEEPWHDWIMVQWNIDGKEILLPARLLLIIDFDNLKIENGGNNGISLRSGIWLLVRSTEKKCTTNRMEPYKQCLLGTRYKMEKNTQLVPVESVMNSAFVYDSSENNRDTVIHIEHPFQWSTYFQESLATDVISDGLKEKLKHSTFNSIF